ncbi:MAG: hypothetical protein II834_02990 [Bacteroidaceae bacterium]|jgi:hypothetical protein|nr:hypothetical protein [Bacteroidaceae bacterium]MBQ5351468.1 hypothetical protein [Bacteroidaceae bacterium]
MIPLIILDVVVAIEILFSNFFLDRKKLMIKASIVITKAINSQPSGKKAKRPKETFRNNIFVQISLMK